MRPSFSVLAGRTSCVMLGFWQIASSRAGCYGRGVRGDGGDRLGAARVRGGMVYAKVGATKRHNRIIGNISARLYLLLPVAALVASTRDPSSYGWRT